jgi:two-component sensor histidine kinase
LADSICSQTINDFISEFATNSVKHGKATHGEITIEQFEEMEIKITMINDGLLLPAKIKHGLGSIMVLQQSLSVVHENLSDGRVYFAATIPISK